MKKPVNIKKIILPNIPYAQLAKYVFNIIAVKN